ncbi:hydrolase [Schizosaccharomyces japonicus yFS275]|uniref:Hydrolase n=1 Tax=Schizosaccharomyces japonicus (strain yFS275 / FY16936) TaxID=402676 RepID=B6K700_SCHJY|nr:hydrolase [Schizosaccharomyces japonicus yFS275]EEB09304.1 hydrolase [Schizosaccharomyces japonicus yFS275]
MKSLKLITFDAFGTLIHLKQPVPHTYTALSKKYNFQFNVEEVEKLSLQAFKHNAEKYPNHGHANGLCPRTWWSAVIQESFPEKIPEALVSEIWHFFASKEAYDLHPNLKTFTDYCKRIFPLVKFGIISNTDDRVRLVLRDLGLENLFEVETYSFDAKCEKPSKQIFELTRTYAEKLLGSSIAPEECLHFGDDIIKDVEGAKAAGWNSCYCDISTDLSSELQKLIADQE